MAKRTRNDLLDAMAEHVLAEGLNTASLRPLARAAGTSDRMLIYHFGSKEGLIDALLGHLAAALSARLDHAFAGHRFANRGEALQAVVSLMRAPQQAGYGRVWLDVLSAAGQGSAAHRSAAQTILQGFIDWLARRLPAQDAAPQETAAALMTLVEGVVVMDAAGHSAAADRAVALLGPRLDQA
ncbi:TetR/AcrR family transcriptional regulator [Sulfitobacter albidus]|uniref:TetR/AcrR family transcriptional regulator n=1 Tax=Sulfitobacter albidus TaxID=2829501 RepID=A0A975JBU3_9RHOB|nr:TetR/AcrR family transcriptional regulator [Sulfitobacter albidus]QUJ75571.1 TetR/AcrR family transcriptional regulator [Sulfitobacter albidus]